MAISFRRITKRFFIISNIVIAALFLVSCYGYMVDPQKFWFISLVALGSFYFLLLLLGFIFFWLVANPRYTLISILAMLFAWVPLKLRKLFYSLLFSLK